MTTLRFILGDQLNRTISSLADIDTTRDVVLMCEVMGEATYVPHHKKKIVFVLSAMRHFAQQLSAAGIRVHYVKLDDPFNTHTFDGELKRACQQYQPQRIVMTESGEWRVQQMIEHFKNKHHLPVEVRHDNRFFATRQTFADWAQHKKQLRMEFFYRQLRQAHNILMDDDTPCGGQWNFDADNRQPWPKNRPAPRPYLHQPDVLTQSVMKLVGEKFPQHFGDIEPMHLATTRDGALAALDYFITHHLPHFGAYQDAMLTDEPFLYHANLSAYLNIGLLLPREVCAAAEQAYRQGQAPLNAVEGFIRQILGWREFIRGIYWHLMPTYADKNVLHATRPLPQYYWAQHTNMHCLSQAVKHTQQYAYSHHIQRLMITGNFALLAGLDVKEVCNWYLLVYADAYDWVELPNTLGMALHADGGIVGSKPYATSGKYIHRMSNFCTTCYYDVKRSVGDRACPFNSLYWRFIHQHLSLWEKNPRMRTIAAAWRRMDVTQQTNILQQAEFYLTNIESL